MRYKPTRRHILLAIVITLIIVQMLPHRTSSPSEYPQEALQQAAKLVNKIYPDQIRALADNKYKYASLNAIFTKDSIGHWSIKSGVAGVITVPPDLMVDYLTLDIIAWVKRSDYHKVSALALYTGLGTVIVSRPVLDRLEDPLRVVLGAMVARPDSKPMTVQPGISYIIEAPGVLLANGPLEYDTILPQLALGETVVVTNATGELRIYPPTSGAPVKVLGVYLESGQVYIANRSPIKVLEANKLNGRLLFGSDVSLLIGDMDGEAVPVTPGNPVILKVPGEGFLLLDLAPGVSRAPAELKLYKYTEQGWTLEGATWLIPSRGALALPVSPGPSGLVMLVSTSTVMIDRARWASPGQVEPVSLESLRPLEYTVEPALDGSHIVVRYPREPGIALVRVEAFEALGPVRVMAGAHVSRYGDLLIAGPPVQPVVGPWGFSWSDIVEIPAGARDIELELVALGQRDGPPVMVPYIRSLLYPVVATAIGPPSGMLGYQMQTFTIAGFPGVHAGSRLLDVNVNIVAGRIVRDEPLIPLKLGVDRVSVGICPLDYYSSPMIIAPGNGSAGFDYIVLADSVWKVGEPSPVLYMRMYTGSDKPELANNVPLPFRTFFRQILDNLVTYALVDHVPVEIYGKHCKLQIYEAKLGLFDRYDAVYMGVNSKLSIAYERETMIVFTFNWPSDAESREWFYIVYFAGP